MDNNEEIVVNELPKNRKQVFAKVLKHKFGTLLGASCLSFIFFVPMFIELIFFRSAMAKADNVDLLFKTLVIAMALFIPLFVIGYTSFGGLFNVTKKLAWGDDISASEYFFKGLKENIVRCLLLGLVNAVAFFLLVIGGAYFYLYDVTGKSTTVLVYILLILITFLVNSTSTYVLAQGVYYTNKIGEGFRNAIMFSLLNFFFNIILIAFSIVLLFVLLSINVITGIIAMGLFAFTVGIFALIYTLLAHKVFDSYINIKYHPEYLNRGLDPTTPVVNMFDLANNMNQEETNPDEIDTTKDDK